VLRAAHEQWVVNTPASQYKSDHALMEFRSAMNALWPTLSTDDRADVLAYAGDCASDETDGFYATVQLDLLRRELEAANWAAVEQLLRGLWDDVIGYTPIEFLLASRIADGPNLRALDLLFDAASSTKCEDARARLGEAARRSLSAVCTKSSSISMAELRLWLDQHREELKIDPAYRDALIDWDGVSVPPPLVVPK
jgi:hypothetical protein